jgi:hypothetical protein
MEVSGQLHAPAVLPLILHSVLASTDSSQHNSDTKRHHNTLLELIPILGTAGKDTRYDNLLLGSI